jgi:uncharacterized membrane protein YidH (DUF202 family)
MMPVPGGEGLQPERTALAWQRTAVTATVVPLPLIVVGARLGAWPLVVLGSVCVVTGAVLATRAGHRVTQLHPDLTQTSPWEPMRSVALVATLAAAGAVVTALAVVSS